MWPSRLASIDLPEPGGPIMQTLCPPAAATVRARLTLSWPRTSRKSKCPSPSASLWVNGSPSSAYGSTLGSPLRKAIAWASVLTGITSRPSTTAASRAFSGGTITPLNPRSLASSASERPPLIF